jgi:hypothetical protein
MTLRIDSEQRAVRLHGSRNMDRFAVAVGNVGAERWSLVIPSMA